MAYLAFWMSDVSDFKPSYQAVKGQRAEQLQTPPAVWKAAGQKKNPQHRYRENQHISSEKKKQKLECHVIKAVIESSVIFKNWWQRCKLIACIHSLHLISCFLFPTKSHIQETHRFFFPSFCEARFLNKMHKSKRRSVTAAWMNFPFSVLNATDLKYLPYYLNYCVKAGMSSDDDILSIQ